MRASGSQCCKSLRSYFVTSGISTGCGIRRSQQFTEPAMVDDRRYAVLEGALNYAFSLLLAGCLPARLRQPSEVAALIAQQARSKILLPRRCGGEIVIHKRALHKEMAHQRFPRELH